ncbi:hypothetical protein [Aestuariimicrobium ganziense]|uniref:hypothetical protein n=1 Tax=Aestuariimicrobium ganziense TaxID=2773677 RepID=UPI0019409A45|nr:hypothetical protein [Aestuariimicrobium ganziense]
MGELFLDAGRAIANVAIVGLVLGAGVPAIFALGMRALGIGRPVSADSTDFTGPATATGRALSLVFFATAVAAVLFGFVVIIWGKQLFS